MQVDEQFLKLQMRLVVNRHNPYAHIAAREYSVLGGCNYPVMTLKNVTNEEVTIHHSLWSLTAAYHITLLAAR